ncbi:DUF2169 domain-containing protein [Sphingomonas sp. NPDC079357]|uniref:DUF2169 family type VI secretion system accessory protein n=1 Tax=Sphingomonas sp. NPDC079357 TaxID=3364518 RepID=UPI00384C4AB4
MTLAFALDAPSILRAQAEMWPLVLPLLGGEPLDLGQPKPFGEWLLAGRSFAPGGVAAESWEAAVTVGERRKRLVIHGPRVWEDGRLQTTLATVMPTGWANAWGGEGVADNPLGLGWRPGATTPVIAPSVEHPDFPWQGPDRRCRAWSPAPLAMTDPSRLARIGTIGADHVASAFPGYPADFDPRFFQNAPDDQQCASPWRGDEEFVLQHWHPTAALITGRLPGLRATVHVGAAEGPLSPIAMRLTTIWFVPEAMLGVLVYHGETATDRLDGGDVARAIVGFEPLDDAQLGCGHYESRWAQRTARTTDAALASLDDGMLLPPGFSVRFDALAAGERRQIASMPPRLDPQVMLAEAIDRVREEVGSGDDHDVAAKITAMLGDLKAVGVDEADPAARRQAVAGATAAAAQIRGSIDVAKLQAAIAEMREAHPVPPSPDPAALAEGLIALRDLQRTGAPPALAASSASGDVNSLLRLIGYGPVASGVKQLPDRALLEARLTDMVGTLPSMADFPDPATLGAAPDDGERSAPLRFKRLDPASLRRGRAGRVAAAPAGTLHQRLDLRGCDLSGRELRGQTFMDCDLRAADLRGARLYDSRFLRCDAEEWRCEGGHWQGLHLTATRLDRLISPARVIGATICGCNAGYSRWSGQLDGLSISGGDWSRAAFSGATLRRCTFVDTDLSESRFDEANLEMTVMTGVALTGGDWSRVCVTRGSLHGVKMPRYWQGASLIASTLRGATFAACDLSGSCFTQVDVSHSDFSEADLSDVVWRDCQGTALVMRSARLDRAQLRGVHALGADLRDASFRDAVFDGCWFPEARWSGADRTGMIGTTSCFLPEARS